MWSSIGLNINGGTPYMNRKLNVIYLSFIIGASSVAVKFTKQGIT